MKGKYLIGLIFIVLGIGFLLNQFNIWEFSQIIGDWWPLIIVIVGVVNITKNPNSLFWGLMVIVIGLLLLGNNLDMLPGGFWGTFWPLMLILLGVGLLSSRFRNRLRRTIGKDNFDYFALFSGLTENIESDNFHGGHVSVMFGGAEIDMRNAIIPPEGAAIDISCAFGGVELIVPQNWRIKTNGTPILGALDNKTIQNIQESDDAPLLKINYFVIFGGIEIKNLKKKDYYHKH